MNEIIEALEIEIKVVVRKAQEEEQFLDALNRSIKRGLNVTIAPSTVLAKIAILEGKMHGLELAIAVVRESMKVNA